MPGKTAEAKQVKVKLSYSATSHADKLILSGKTEPKIKPVTLGREGVGMVTETGAEVTNVARGDRVVIDPYIFCDSCASCREGKSTSCLDLRAYGMHEDGFLSDFAIVNCGDVFKLPDRVRDDEAVFSSHVALALNIMSKLKPEKGEHIVIMGAGVVGIILAQVAIYYQAVPIVVDTRGDRLKIAEDLGVYYCINSVDEDVYKKIFSLTGGSMSETMCHFSYDDINLAQSLEFLAPGGRLAIAGLSDTKSEISGSFFQIFNHQLSVFGVSNGAKLIPAAINMLANKAVTPRPLISKEISFEEVGDTLADEIAHPQKYVKVLVKM
jgi:threonine dehydrogenase-like Zn-dependent dehydrogenase